jgi:ubiquinone/menaquinone biosynthesis C-methylase UbiE
MAGPERVLISGQRQQLLGAARGSVLDVGAGTGASLGQRAEQQRAEQLEFADASFDTVVFTLSLCTVGSPRGALAEARRVRRPDGRLLVFEHVRAAEPALARWQDRLTPPWSPLAGGCQLNRDTRAAIEQAGFAFDHVTQTRDSRMGLAVVQPLLYGIARPKPRAA